jgi:hypothetical protein
MNGRVYDPLTAMFFSPDPYLQAPGNWLNYNRYGYCLNNPFLYTDPDGEIAWFVPIIVGAIISGAGYTANVAFSNGGFDNWNWGQFIKSVGIGAVSGAITAGIGVSFGAIGTNGIAGEALRAVSHGAANGIMSGIAGGDFTQGFAAGALSSLAGSAFMMYGGSFANSPVGTYAFSGLAGGIGAELTGGNFYQGAAIGLMTAGLNHLAQTVLKPSFEDLLANFPTDENGSDMPAEEVYELIGGKVFSEHQRDPQSYHNACALRVSRALNGSAVSLPDIPGQTLKGADGRNYFFRAKDLYNWMTRSYGKPNISTLDASKLNGNQGIYIMRASYPARFGAWGHATLYNQTGTVGHSYIGSYAHSYNLWNFK